MSDEKTKYISSDYGWQTESEYRSSRRMSVAANYI